MSFPKIYVHKEGFPDKYGCQYVATAEDGAQLTRHFCSCDSWAESDFGLPPFEHTNLNDHENHMAKDKYEKYDAHYPSGWELVFSDPEEK